MALQAATLATVPAARAHSRPTGSLVTAWPAAPSGGTVVLCPISRLAGARLQPTNALIEIRFHFRHDCEHIDNPHSLPETAVWGRDAARCHVCADRWPRIDAGQERVEELPTPGDPARWVHGGTLQPRDPGLHSRHASPTTVMPDSSWAPAAPQRVHRGFAGLRPPQFCCGWPRWSCCSPTS